MTRTLTLAGLLLAALATCAVAQKDQDKDKKDKPKVKKFATPRECFATVLVAIEKRDAPLMVSCLTPTAVQNMAVEMAVDGLRERAGTLDSKVKDKEEKDKGKDDRARKYKPVFDVMDRHGLTEKATKDLKIKGFRATKEEREAILKLVKDPAAFAGEYMTVRDKIEGRPEPKDSPKPKLADLKIDGDKATANVVVAITIKKSVKDKDKGKDEVETKEQKYPIKFEKVKGGWLLDPQPAKDDAPKEKKEAKDKGKDQPKEKAPPKDDKDKEKKDR